MRINDDVAKAKTVNVIKRDHAKSNPRPSTKCGNRVKRGLVTFSVYGQLRRLGVDVIFSERLQKPKVFEFVAACGHGKTARFYFPMRSGDAEVKSLICEWFKGLGMHDSCKSFTVCLEPAGDL
jgi:hypothetical protein